MIPVRIRRFVQIHLLPRLGGDRRIARVAFIESYGFPAAVRADFAGRHPDLGVDDCARVFDALRAFFAVCAIAPGAVAGMPSRIVEEAWHVFVAHPGDYARFCARAFGRDLPAAPDTASEAALTHTWTLACARERIEPYRPSRLPSLFAIDRALKVPNGRYYALNETDSQAARRQLDAAAIVYLAVAVSAAGSASAGSASEWEGAIADAWSADAAPGFFGDAAGGSDGSVGDLGGGDPGGGT